MKPFATLPALASAALISATNIASAAPTPLFDGESFAGWEGDTEKVWRVADGAIVGGSLDAKGRE